MTIQNGAPAPVVQPSKANGINESATPAPAAAPDLATRLAALEKERDEYRLKAERAEKKVRVNESEMRKFSEQKSGLGTKLSEHAKWAKAFEAAGVTADDLVYAKANPEPIFKKMYGENWYDKMVEWRINGGSLSGDALTAELERRDQRILSTLEEKAKAEKAEADRIANERAQQARQQLTEEAAGFLEKNWSEYPIFEGNDKMAVAQALSSYIESHWKQTGKVLTNKEAADALEGSEIARAERIASADKYKARLTEKLKPATVATTGAPQSRSTAAERRTLSNDLTATTPGQKRTPRTDEERMQAILAMRFDK